MLKINAKKIILIIVVHLIISVIALVIAISITAVNNVPETYTLHVSDDGVVIYEIIHPQRNIRFFVEDVDTDIAISPLYNHIPFAEAAIIASDIIYQSYGFCIDGLTGDMFLLDNLNPNTAFTAFWRINIVSDEHTRHCHCNVLFHLIIDATEGKALELYMNTVETPFGG